MIEEAHAPPGGRFMLKAVPFSKNIVFGAEGTSAFTHKSMPKVVFKYLFFIQIMNWCPQFFSYLYSDVKELISILADGQGEFGVRCSYKMDTPDSICPTRVRAMLASRACRTSVMIGHPLTKTEMRKVTE